MKNLLDNRAITQLELAEAIGVSRQRVWFWLSGKQKPQKRHIKKLALFFGIEIEKMVQMINDLEKKEPKKS